jgi:hypothetical protein
MFQEFITEEQHEKKKAKETVNEKGLSQENVSRRT